MVCIKGLHVQVLREGTVLQEYGTTTNNAGDKISCYIPSVAGDTFTVIIFHLPNPPPEDLATWYELFDFHLYMDGLMVAEIFSNVPPIEYTFEGADQLDSTSFVRPFMFRILPLTRTMHDSERREEVLKNLGTIRLSVHRTWSAVQDEAEDDAERVVKTSNDPTFNCTMLDLPAPAARTEEWQHAPGPQKADVYKGDARTLKHDVECLLNSDSYGAVTPKVVIHGVLHRRVEVDPDPLFEIEFRYRTASDLRARGFNVPDPFKKSTRKRRSSNDTPDLNMEDMFDTLNTIDRDNKRKRAREQLQSCQVEVQDLTGDDPLMPEICLIRPPDSDDEEEYVPLARLIKREREEVVGAAVGVGVGVGAAMAETSAAQQLLEDETIRPNPLTLMERIMPAPASEESQDSGDETEDTEYCFNGEGGEEDRKSEQPAENDENAMTLAPIEPAEAPGFEKPAADVENSQSALFLEYGDYAQVPELREYVKGAPFVLTDDERKVLGLPQAPEDDEFPAEQATEK
ncbi:hypothetical protein SAICODRAFT_68752 [Saitoella complicata NRRL Y-17804]|uniref:uncharacterized protein n=1 Tax=Saitoella complicata (strain BCRC 22490 / CBS 7301 / JCM 7358 / NBRC 10748 / NRRL Y-17804) TaxID=698492 RepID=UPI00086822A7|nr:uncharacterized protein SAICODRAFT_68752 [Saitoella complicata NRRL Y-17804]ODQ56419.1 hypothetical protein SAICODRAFT_68752 [Saitoella complicata NRRL Y-17804]